MIRSMAPSLLFRRSMKWTGLALAIACWSSAAGAETIALLPATGANVHPGILQASRDLLGSHLEETGRFHVVPLPDAEPSESTPAQAAERAHAAGAALVG